MNWQALYTMIGVMLAGTLAADPRAKEYGYGKIRLAIYMVIWALVWPLGGVYLAWLLLGGKQINPVEPPR